MDYYYEFQLYKGITYLSDELPQPPLHSQRINSEEELIEIFRVNGVRYSKWNIVPQIHRYDKQSRFVVVLEKGFGRGYKYYKFKGQEALKSLQDNSALWLHNATGKSSVSIEPGVYFYYSTADYTQYFVRPWDRHDSDERVQELVKDAERFMDALEGRFQTEDFNPYIYPKHPYSGEEWYAPFVKAGEIALKEKQVQ